MRYHLGPVVAVEWVPTDMFREIFRLQHCAAQRRVIRQKLESVLVEEQVFTNTSLETSRLQHCLAPRRILIHCRI